MERDDGSADRRRIPAPALRETADIWFDTGRDPVIEWDEAGGRFDLVDPEGEERIRLLTTRATSDPRRVASVLATGLAACDFPPTGGGASETHVDAALRAHGLDPHSL